MKITNLTLGDAVNAAVATGCKIRRSSWVGTFHWSVDKSLRIRTCDGDPIEAHAQDICANDWEIITDQLKLMTFQEAVEVMKQGKCVRRFGKRTLYSPITIDDALWLSIADIDATDWIIDE